MTNAYGQHLRILIPFFNAYYLDNIFARFSGGSKKVFSQPAVSGVTEKHFQVKILSK
jgi:hypothetical protein